jgi:adenylate cyclase
MSIPDEAVENITNIDRSTLNTEVHSSRLPRKLAAILHADVAGYSRLSGADEDGTHRTLRASFDRIVACIKTHNGRVVNCVGDAVLADFSTVVDALECATKLQQQLATSNQAANAEQKMLFRMGINLGDVIIDREELFGEGVNVAARLSSLSKPGEICISESVRTALGQKLPLQYEYIGEKHVKNIVEPVRVYRVITGSATTRLLLAALRVHARTFLIVGLLAVVAVAGVFAFWGRYPGFGPPPAVVSRAEAASRSIAVLPFVNVSEDTNQDYFADGIADDLITGLTKISGLLVIARDSSFVYRSNGAPTNVRQIARQLNVRYILEGSVRRNSAKVRINVQLIDAETGTNLWAERYDGDVGNVFALQDQMTRKIISALAVELTSGEREKLAQQDTKNADAYQYFLQGQAYYYHHSKADNREAQKLYEKTIALDPKFARAYAMYAMTYWFDFANGWSDEPNQSLDRAWDLAQQSIGLHDALPEAHFVIGLVHRERREYTDALAEAEKAIELDPNYANGRVLLASILYYAGRAEEGLKQMQEAILLNPHHPHNYPFHLGQAYFILGNYEKAIELFRQGLASNPTSHRLRLWLASAYALSGRQNEAEWELDLILIKDPDFSLKHIQQAYPFKYSADLGVFLDGLRKAGLSD